MSQHVELRVPFEVSVCRFPINSTLQPCSGTSFRNDCECLQHHVQRKLGLTTLQLASLCRSILGLLREAGSIPSLCWSTLTSRGVVTVWQSSAVASMRVPIVHIAQLDLDV